MGTAQLAGKKKKEQLFSKNKIFKKVHFFQINTFYVSFNANKSFFFQKYVVRCSSKYGFR